MMAQVNQAYLDTLSTSERQKYAKRTRKHQMKRFLEWSKTEESDGVIRKSKSKKTVNFSTETQIHDAVKRQDTEEVKELLGKGANPDTLSPVNRFSLLHQCGMDNSWEVADLLIAKGASVNHLDAQLWSSLHVSCAYESQDMVSLLLEMGADACLLNVDNCFAVDLSTDEDIRESIFDVMGRASVGLDEMKGLRQKRAGAMLEDLKLVIPDRLDPDTLDNRGIAFIHIAAANGYGEVAKFLLKKKSDINLQDSCGYTALHLAALFNQEKMVRFLLKKGADPRMVSHSNETALSLSADDVIRQILSNAVSAAVRKAEMMSEFEALEKTKPTKLDINPTSSSSPEQGSLSSPSSPPPSGSTGQQDEEFVCNIKPNIYKRSFIRASDMAKLDEMFERETLPDKTDLSEQEMDEVSDRVKISSMKIKGMLKASFKGKKTPV